MAEIKVPPGLAAAISALGKIGYRAISAGVAEALKGVSEITGEADARVKRGARAAERMAKTGEPYHPDEEEEEDDDT
jgi:hypothetical protein